MAATDSIVPAESIEHLDCTSGTVSVNGVDLYFERYGSGPHVILSMPGAIGGTIFFKPQINHFGRSGSGFTFVTYDPRGYGRSRPSSRVYSSPIYYEIDGKDAVGLMKALGFNKFSILGWCEGGTCAIITAARFPDMIKSLVVWGAHSYLEETDIEIFHKWKSIDTWDPKIRATNEQYYGKDLALVWDKWFKGFISVYYDPLRQGDICKKEVREVQCPTLILHGNKDQVIPFYHIEFLQRNLQKHQCEIIPGGKHSLHLKHSSIFNSIVDAFITKHK